MPVLTIEFDNDQHFYQDQNFDYDKNLSLRQLLSNSLLRFNASIEKNNVNKLTGAIKQVYSFEIERFLFFVRKKK